MYQFNYDSGELQGRLLSLISKIKKPKYILEIGTFTGYSALCLAEGLKKGGEIQIRYIEGINFYKNILEKIKNKIYERAGENFPLKFSNVKEIRHSPSGKPQIVIREY